MKKKINILPFLILVILVNSCSKDISDNQNLNQKKNNIEKNVMNNKKENISNDSLNKIVKKIKISDKCIWCWRCVITDSEHFKINTETMKPDIISNENIDSNLTQAAILNCPVKAIYIS